MNDRVAVATAVPANLRGRTWRWFFVVMSAAMLAFVLVGFARTFFLRAYLGTAELPAGLQTLPPYLYVHGVVLTSWFLLFLTQTVLVATNRTDLHRRLGVVGVVLAAGVVATGLITTIRSVSRSPSNGTPLPEEPIVFGTSVGFLLAFSLLVVCGIYSRRRPETHKRLMFLATFSIVGPAVGRLPALKALPLLLLVLQLSPLIALVLYDAATEKRVHHATIIGGLLSILIQVLGGVLAITGSGRAFIQSLG
jgi:hypothetical protein